MKEKNLQISVIGDRQFTQACSRRVLSILKILLVLNGHPV